MNLKPILVRVFLIAAALACADASLRAETTAYSGATAITGLPITLSSPGTYYLTQDFSVNLPSDPAITIAASGVTVDLNGHTITNTNGSANYSDCFIAGNQNAITVRNGTISGFYAGIVFGGSRTTTTSYGHLVENVTFSQNTNYGVNLAWSFASKIYRCRGLLMGGGNNSSSEVLTNFNFVGGSGNVVEDCDVSGRAGVAYIAGINMGSGSGLAFNNRLSGIDMGIFGNNYKYRDNLTSGIASPYSGGTDVGGNN